MSAKRSQLLAYTRLLRLPIAFIAMADPLAGWFAIGGGVPARNVLLLAIACACLFSSGAVFNDLFDYDLDCVEHPDRPLPSGVVSRQAARVLAVALMIAGFAFAGIAGPVPFCVALFLGAMTFFYNAWARDFTTLR